MTTKQMTVEDFHPAPKAIAQVAKGLSYETKEWQGHKYHGIGLGYEVEGMKELLQTLTKCKIEIPMSYFRLGTSTVKATTHIHADHGCGSFAYVWYLNEAPKGISAGTAFWKHKEYDIDEMVTAEKAFELDASLTEEEFIKKLNSDGNDESKWTLTGLVGQKFNRLTVYPTTLFHSRYPKDAWGETAEDGRIVNVGFFNLI